MFAYNLRIINADARYDLRIIKDIRNQFSHTYLPLSFNTDKIRAKCDNLKLTIKLIPPLSETVHDDARGKYIKSILTNMSHLISDMIFSKYEKILLEENKNDILNKTAASIKNGDFSLY